MIIVNCVVEGQTEETFIRDVLSDHLSEFDVFTYASCVTTGQSKHQVFKGGGSKYSHLKRDIINWMKQDTRTNVFYSCMFDVYALPRDFPGKSELNDEWNADNKIVFLEQRLKNDIIQSVTWIWQKKNSSHTCRYMSLKLCYFQMSGNLSIFFLKMKRKLKTWP